MVFTFVEDDLFVKLTHFAVNACTQETVFVKLFEFLFELALSTADDGGQDHNAFTLGQFRNALDDLIDRLPRDRSTALMAMRLANGRKKQAKKIVDLGHSADRRAGRTRHRLLLDRDRGA